MKKNDCIFILVMAVIFVPFMTVPVCGSWFKATTTAHPYGMAFLKFALLATLGEMIGLRLKSGIYNYKGFGLAARAIVWGVLGVGIASAMKIFATGVPVWVETLGFGGVVEAMKGGFTVEKLVGALCISTVMNVVFAPIFMTVHKITDTHIIDNQGRIGALMKPIAFGEILASLNWSVQWNFVFKKTIPLFWIPAHTVTFLLPASVQVLFAASLSIVLGILLSVAAVLSRQKQQA